MTRLCCAAALALACLAGCSATCQEACDNLYACLTDTTAPKTECVNKCETDPGKGKAENRDCIAEASCQELKEGRCPDLIVR